MRRTTLGTLNIGNQSRPVTREKKSSLGPRPSIGNRASVGRPSTSGRTSTSGRPSLANARSATGRRPSSQYGHGVQTMMKDPRPLTDRGYQQKMIRYLMEFLTEFNYPYQISMRTLSAPSMKEFCNIFQFLYKYIKADTQKTTALDSKPAEEIPRIFKTLGYPFNISKSNLYSVGSPHAWPIVLGALCWLIELIRHAMSIGQDIEGHVLFPEDNYHPDDYQDEGPQPEEKCFFQYLEKSYEAFMMGKELDELGEYDAEFIDNIRSRNASLLEGMEELIKESVSLEEELNALKSDSTRLQTLAERKITLTSDSEKFQNYLGDLEKHRKQLDEKNDQLVEELQGLKVEQDAATQENAILQQTLNNQELSAGDVERMKHDKRELQKAIEQLEKERDYYDQQIWEKEMQYAKKHEETEKQIREYNEMTRKLKLIPSSAENANGIDFEMHYNPHAQGPDQRAQLDFKGTIKPALLRLKQNISEKSRTIQSQIITEDEAFDQINEMVQDKQEEVTGLGMKLQAVDKDLNWKKEIMSKEYQKNNGTAQSLEEGVQQMRTKVLAREEAIGIKENKLQELNLRVEQSGVERQEEKEEYSDFILKACRMIMEHKTLIQDRTHKVNEQAEEIAEQTKQAEVPKSSITIPDQMEEEQS